MKTIKKINILFLSMLFFQINMIANEEQPDTQEFQPFTTDGYIYEKSVVKNENYVYNAIFDKKPNGITISDSTTEDLLSTRVRRTKIETKIEDGVSITTTETWISRNPSYLTWINGMLVTSTIAATILGATAINSATDIVTSVLNNATNYEINALNHNPDNSWTSKFLESLNKYRSSHKHYY